MSPLPSPLCRDQACLHQAAWHLRVPPWAPQGTATAPCLAPSCRGWWTPPARGRRPNRSSRSSSRIATSSKYHPAPHQYSLNSRKIRTNGGKLLLNAAVFYRHLWWSVWETWLCIDLQNKKNIYLFFSEFCVGWLLFPPSSPQTPPTCHPSFSILKARSSFGKLSVWQIRTLRARSLLERSCFTKKWYQRAVSCDLMDVNRKKSPKASKEKQTSCCLQAESRNY